jgi:hypothetical protein
MSNHNTSDDWIHKYRIEIYEKTKNISFDEIQDYFTKSAEEAAKKYGFTIEKPLNEAQDIKKNITNRLLQL